MKKKIITFILLVCGLVSLTACGESKIDINDYVIENRECLFVAEDELYCATLSTGMREENYSFDGVVNKMVPFGIITLSRHDSAPLANDEYTYILTVGEDSMTGFLEATAGENSYSIDVETAIPADATINLQITFTGYNFNQNMNNISKDFTVDNNTAIDIANKELSEEIKNICSDKNNKIEVVCKILKDYSNSEIKSYYYYIGILSTNGETIGILIDANSGEILAKKI